MRCICYFLLLLPLSVFSYDRYLEENYAQNSPAQFFWSSEIILNYPFHGEEKILDIGCKDGRTSALLAHKVPKGSVLGIDTIPSMITLAKKTYSARKNLQFALLDIEMEPFAEKVDLITAFFSFNWIKRPKETLIKLHSLLCQGGKILMVTSARTPEILNIACIEVMSKEKWKSFFEDYKFPIHFLTYEEWNQTLLAANLQPIRVEIFQKKVLTTKNQFFKGLASGLCYLDVIPENLRYEFLKEVIESYLHMRPVENNRITMDVEVVVVLAKKLT